MTEIKRIPRLYEWLDDLEDMNPAKSRFFFRTSKGYIYGIFLRWQNFKPWEAFLVCLGKEDGSTAQQDFTSETLHLGKEYSFTELGLAKEDSLGAIAYKFYQEKPDDQIEDPKNVIKDMYEGRLPIHAMRLSDIRTFRELYVENPDEAMFTEEPDPELYISTSNGKLQPVSAIGKMNMNGRIAVVLHTHLREPLDREKENI